MLECINFYIGCFSGVGMGHGYELGRMVHSEDIGSVYLSDSSGAYDALIGKDLIALPRGTLDEIGRGSPSCMKYVMGQLLLSGPREEDVERFLLRALVNDLERQKSDLLSKIKPEDL